MSLEIAVLKRKSAIAVLVNQRIAVRREGNAARIRKGRSTVKVQRDQKAVVTTAMTAAATTTVTPTARNQRKGKPRLRPA